MGDNATRFLHESIIAYLIGVARPAATAAAAESIDLAVEALRDAWALPVTRPTLAGVEAATLVKAVASLAPVEASPWERFLANLKAKGYFGEAVEGSDAYNKKVDLARAKFEARVGGTGGSASVASAAPPAAASDADEAAADAAKTEGNAHLAAGRYERAIDCYSQALEAAPSGKNAKIYFVNRATAKIKAGDHSGAVDDCNAALARDASYVKAHVQLGVALQGVGRPSDAVAAYEAALELDADNANAKANLVLARAEAARSQRSASAVERRGTAAPAAPSATPGVPDMASLLGSLGGGASGGLAGLLSNPALQQAAASMMQNPAMMQQMMQMMGGPGGMAGLASMLGGQQPGSGGAPRPPPTEVEDDGDAAMD